MLYRGPIGATADHAHRATQVIVTDATTPLTVALESDDVVATRLCIPSGVRHRIVVGAPRGLIAFLEPDAEVTFTSIETTSPSSFDLGGDITTRRDAEVMLHQLTGSRPPNTATGTLHPAITAALAMLPVRLAAGTVALSEVARAVGLSPSRFAHAFRDQTGSAWRPYVRWARLNLAARELSAGATLSEAAHRSGFADAAHFSRTFRAMFGITPSTIAGHVRWITA